MKTILNMDTRENYYEANQPWSPDSGVASSPASSSGLTPHNDIHGQQYSPFNANYYHYQQILPTDTTKPYLDILEEPCNMFRFRYQSEMHGTHGSLMGHSSERSQKKYPTVALRGYTGPEAYIRCTLYQVEKPGRQSARRPHSHKLVIKKGVSEECDPHIVVVKQESGFQAIFQGMGIIHTAKKDIPDELVPKMIRMEEYTRQSRLTEFDIERLRREAVEEAKSMNLNQVCLCFQAFASENGLWQEICNPVYSQTINNIKSALTGELKICRVSTTVSQVTGNQEVYLLVEKVNKGDIHVEFYEKDGDGSIVWRQNAKVIDVHHQYAIVIETPPYHNQNIDRPVDVFFELYRGKDGCRSKPWAFKYKPQDPMNPRKRARTDEVHDNLPSFLNVSYGDEFTGMGDDIDPETIQKIFQELESFDGNFGEHFGENLALDSASSSQQMTSQPRNLTKTKTFSGSTFFKLAIILVRKHGTFPNTADNLLKVFKEANRRRQNFFHFAVESNIHAVVDWTLKTVKRFQLDEVLSLRNVLNETCLHLAVINGRSQFIKQLIACGVDPNLVDVNGNTPVHVCIMTQNMECLQSIITSCIDAATKLNFQIANYEGISPLHLAVHTSQIDMIKYLVDSPFDLYPYDTEAKTGGTILHAAVKQKSLEVVRYIVETFRNENVDLLNTVDQADHYPIHSILGKSDEDNDDDEEDAVIDQEEMLIAIYLIEQGAKTTGVPESIMKKLEDYQRATNHITLTCAPVASTSHETDDADTVPIVCPLVLDKRATDELSAILKAADRWRQVAALLEIDDLVSVWESTDNPSKCLLDYIQAVKIDAEQLCTTFQALELYHASGVIDSMVSRQLSLQ